MSTSDERSAEGAPRSTSERPQFRYCAAPAHPVTAAELVDAFRANHITLEPNQRACTSRTRPGFTNLGSDGISEDSAVTDREGTVLCDLAPSGQLPLETVRFPSEVETLVEALNVSCVVYPSDSAHEREQVDRLERAVRALVTSRR